MADNDNPKICLFDLDGTLADYDFAMRRDLTAMLAPGERLPLDLHDESLEWLKTRRQMVQRQPGWWANLPRLQLGWDVLREASSIGFSAHVLTKGPFSTAPAWAEKVQWCQANLPGVPITITRDKSLVYGRVLVDDWPDYVEPWLEKRPRGWVIMPAHPWNENFRHDRAVRYDGTNKGLVTSVLENCFNR